MADLTEDKLLKMAREAFDAIEQNTSIRLWSGRDLATAHKAFDDALAGRGIAWIVDSATSTGLSHLGLMAWMQSARELLKDSAPTDQPTKSEER